ncbi:MAG: H-NS histone family protein [Pseudomonadota bacterium]
MNLKSMSAAELNKLKAAVEKEIDSRKKTQRNKALGEIKSIAAKYGLKLSEVVSAPAGQVKNRKPKAKKPVKSTEKKIAYRHPENPQLTWSGGRGRRPQWVKDWEAAGRLIDEAKVC